MKTIFLLQSKEEMNTMITTRIEEMWETLDRNQSYQSTCFDKMEVGNLCWNFRKIYGARDRVGIGLSSAYMGWRKWIP